uniref:Uncharacterized protein n=1 Tax=Micrurus spixii TaxID=129469 RepID=A0A2D4M1H0_9SAUR
MGRLLPSFSACFFYRTEEEESSQPVGRGFWRCKRDAWTCGHLLAGWAGPGMEDLHPPGEAYSRQVGGCPGAAAHAQCICSSCTHSAHVQQLRDIHPTAPSHHLVGKASRAIGASKQLGNQVGGVAS